MEVGGRVGRVTSLTDRSDEIDAVVEATLAQAIADLGLEKRGWVVAAVGGYGRRHLAPFSDVDLAIIYERLDASRIKTFAERVFYPLWDRQLPLSHGVKSLKEAMSAARQDFHWLTACLDARFLGGDRSLFEKFSQALSAQASHRGGARFLAYLVEAADERRRQYGDCGRLLEPDIKNGHGGLRDIQTLFWASKAGIWSPSQAELDFLHRAEDLLLNVRRCLHELSGRMSDRLIIEFQPAVATRIYPKVEDPERRLSRGFYAATRGVAESLERLASKPPARPAPGVDYLPSDLPEKKSLLMGALRSGRDGLPVLERLAFSGLLTDMLPEWQAIEGLTHLDANHMFAVDTHSFMTVTELAALGAGKYPAELPAAEIMSELDHPERLLLAALLHDVGKGRPGSHEKTGAVLAASAASHLGFDAHGCETIGFLVGHHLLLSHVATRRDLNDPGVVGGVAAVAGDAERLKMLYLLTIGDALATGPQAWNAWRSALVRELFTKCLAELAGEVPPGSYQVGLEERHFDLLDSPEPAQAVFAPGHNGVNELAVVAADQPGLLSKVAGALALSGVNVLAARAYTAGDGRALQVFKVAGAFEPEITDQIISRAQDNIVKAVTGRLALSYRVQEMARRYRGSKPGAKRKPKVVVDNRASDKYTVIEVHAPDQVGLLYKVANALFELDLDIHLAKISTVGAEAVDVFYVSDLSGNKVVDDDWLNEARDSVLFKLDKD